MKKALKILLTFMLFAAISLPAHAAHGAVYTIDKFNMQMMMPSGYYILTQDDYWYPEVRAIYNMTPGDFLNDMLAQNCYLLALAQDGEVNIKIAIEPEDQEPQDFNSMYDELMDLYVDTFRETAQSNGYTQVKRKAVTTSQLKFIRMEYYSPDNATYIAEYISSYKGYRYTIFLISTQQNTLQNHMDDLEYIINNMYITNFAYPAPPLTKTSSFTYTDSRNDFTFTVPANWQTDNYFQPDKYAQVCFVYPADKYAIMTYGSHDYYEDLPPETKEQLDRWDYNISTFDSDEMIEYLMEVNDDAFTVYSVQKESYNGIEYFVAKYTAKSEDNLILPCTQAITLNNGIGYSFICYGWSECGYFPDFEAMLNSVEAPAFERDYSLEFTLAAELIVIAGTVAFFVSAKIKNRKAARASAPPAPNQPSVSAQPAPQKTAKAPQQSPQTAAESTIYCHSCGSPNPKGNSYCINCGTKLADFSEENNKGNTHSICDTRQSATAQYDRVTVDTEHRHSERSEESHLQKITTPPKAENNTHSICDTSQSATAQYDRVTVDTEHRHSERSEESHLQKITTPPKAESHPAPQPAAKIKVKAVKATPADKASKNKK